VGGRVGGFFCNVSFWSPAAGDISMRRQKTFRMLPNVPLCPCPVAESEPPSLRTGMVCREDAGVGALPDETLGLAVRLD
jgi:hypothetical protein